jgi:hypothetical protein
MRPNLPRFLLLAGVAFMSASILTVAARPQDRDWRDRDDFNRGQHTAGVLSRVGIEQYPVGCTSLLGNPVDSNPWMNSSGDGRCSVATKEDNIDGLVVLVTWKTLQPDNYDEPLSSYYIDNAIYSMAHPERQSIRLGVLTGIRSPNWLIKPPPPPGVSFPDRYGKGDCNPSSASAGGPSLSGVPGTIWNRFSLAGNLHAMPNPFGSNSCLFSALDNLVFKLGQTGDYNLPTSSPYPHSLAPYDNLYYDSAPGHEGFVHTNSPTRSMNKIIGHVSVLGPSSYDDESVLCQAEADCENPVNNSANSYNYNLWRSLEPNDFSMEAAIEEAQEKTIEIYARYFPETFWTVDLVERQMPFFDLDGKGCRVIFNQYPPVSSDPTAADASDCFGKLRTDLIDFIEWHYPSRGGVQNNSLGPNPNDVASHPVWRQTALAAQGPPLNPVKLFVGFEVGQPSDFYMKKDTLFGDFEADDQAAVNLAKQMETCFTHVDFIEFYDVDIANNFILAPIDGSIPLNPVSVNKPFSALNDDPDGISTGGYMYVPLLDAHKSLRGHSYEPPNDCHACPCR